MGGDVRFPSTQTELVLLCAEGAQAWCGRCAGENLRGRFEDASFRRSRLRASLSTSQPLTFGCGAPSLFFAGCDKTAELPLSPCHPGAFLPPPRFVFPGPSLPPFQSLLCIQCLVLSQTDFPRLRFSIKMIERDLILLIVDDVIASYRISINYIDLFRVLMFLKKKVRAIIAILILMHIFNGNETTHLRNR